MSEPWTPQFTAAVLRNMAERELAAVTPQVFRMWPARKPLPPAAGKELISAERARRASVAGNRRHVGVKA